VPLLVSVLMEPAALLIRPGRAAEQAVVGEPSDRSAVDQAAVASGYRGTRAGAQRANERCCRSVIAAIVPRWRQVPIVPLVLMPEPVKPWIVPELLSVPIEPLLKMPE